MKTINIKAIFIYPPTFTVIETISRKSSFIQPINIQSIWIIFTICFYKLITNFFVIIPINIKLISIKISSCSFMNTAIIKTMRIIKTKFQIFLMIKMQIIKAMLINNMASTLKYMIMIPTFWIIFLSSRYESSIFILCIPITISIKML